jgi:hypothetical protein
MLFLGLFVGCVAGEDPVAPASTAAADEDAEEGAPLSDTQSLGGRAGDPPIVIGGGVAGMTVAAALGTAILFEATDALGGRACRSGGEMFFVGTPEQRAAGVVDTPADAAADWPALTGGEASEATLRWLEASADVEARLVDEGVTFELPTAFDAHPSRGHLVVGEGPVLCDRVREALPDTVDVRLATKVRELLIDDEGVAGVMVDGQLVPSRTVIIASGGYAGNAEVIQATGVFAEGTWSSGGKAEGSGWAVMAGDYYGFASAHLEALGAYATAVAISGEDGQATGVDGASLDMRSVLVDGGGNTFADGSLFGSFRQSLAVRQHEPVFAIVTGDALPELFTHPEKLARVEAGVTCGGSVRELATAMATEADPLALAVKTLAVKDVRAGRGGLDEAVSGGLCALPIGWSVQKSFGGLDVDLDGRVRDRDGAPVPGLWAVGEAAGMGVPGMGGLVGFDGSLSAIFWSAWRTAEAIAPQG